MSQAGPAAPPVWWCIRTPWEQCVAIDEFGGGRNFGCSAYAIANMEANYEWFIPTYALGEAITNEMIAHGDWLVPLNHGATLQDVHNELLRRGYTLGTPYVPEQGSTIDERLIRLALVPQHAIVLMVANAQALQSNEHGVQWHFVVLAGYDQAADKVYVLNSDVAGQHGVGQGQWQPVAEILAADPRGLAVVLPKAPPTPPVPPIVHWDIAGARADIAQAQTSLGDALKKLS